MIVINKSFEKMEEEERQDQELLKLFYSGSVLLTEVDDGGAASPIYLDVSDIRTWKPIQDGRTLIWGYRMHPICAVKESPETIARIKELAKRNSKY